MEIYVQTKIGVAKLTNHLVIPIFCFVDGQQSTSKVIYQKCQTLPNPPMLKLKSMYQSKPFK